MTTDGDETAEFAATPAALLDPRQDAWFVTAPRTGVPSAWYGHVPFAMWLMRAVRPRLLVELGTQHGVSYSAFCEAAKQARLDTRCFAVDTWQGDAHAGFYGEDVYADLLAFHDQRYAAFSQLLRVPFDEAAPAFAEASVDLLHIDGCHSYEAVVHDFETWRPKLSSRAVVLFHDTNVRERQFGVWSLWRTLAEQHPHFEFLHEHGLGVLAIGEELDGPVAALCRLSDPADIAALRERFALSGQRCRADADRQALADTLARASRQEAAERAETERRQAALEADAAAHRRDLTAARGDAERRLLVALAQETRFAETRAELAQTQRALAAAEAAVAEQRRTLAHQDQLIAHYRPFEQSYHEVLASTSWRVTRPLRTAVAAVPRPAKRWMRRAVKAGWWAATPWKLQRRMERRRELIARAVAPPAVLDVTLAPPALAPPPPERFTLEHVARPDDGYVPLIEWYDPVSPMVSIVVLNRQSADRTRLCLQHLWQHTTGLRYEIIVVDNGSAPDEVASLRREEPLVRVIALGSDRFVGDANNLGVEAARGRFVCLLSHDAFVPPGWLERLHAVFEQEVRVGAVGPRFLDPAGGLLSAGALVSRDGMPTPLGRSGELAFRQRRVVDYVPAACVLLRREDFLRVLGFDLAWDPASYEDVDLGFKLRLSGLQCFVEPSVEVVRVENAPEREDVVAINRAKFLGRWGRFLETSGAEAPALLPERPIASMPVAPAAPTRRVLVYTPYPLTPGGGERYVLTIAEAFKDSAQVGLLTPQPISRIRLQTMARELGLDLDQVELVTPDALTSRPPADLAIVLGNEIFPTTGRLARHNVFICQFPFPFETESAASMQRANWQEFELVLTYSEYVREHVQREAARQNVAPHRVEVLPPPVPMVPERAQKRRGQILHVGRFFTGGHCKRQDALIEALRALVAEGVAAELHLAGSTMPDPAHRAYYAGLIEQATGLPVHFHANCSTETLHRLYAESDLYWHATGVGADLETEPHTVEHFGISVVEAMSARCIPLVFAAGGPAVIVEDGVTGHHWRTLEELTAKTRTLLQTEAGALEGMRGAAERAAQAYDEPTFRARVRAIAERLTG